MFYMLKIRLQRVGRKNDPSFRVVVTDSRRGPRSSRYVEMLGSHNPKQSTTALKNERVLYWIGQGAQTSGTVNNMLISEGVITGKKINVLPKKRPIVKEKIEEKAEVKVEEKTGAETEKASSTAVAPEESVSVEKPKEESAEETTKKGSAEPHSEETILQS